MLKDVLKKSLVTFNKVRKYYGLASVYNYMDFVNGDAILLPDLPELSGLAAEDLPPRYHYTGPIFARMDMPVPQQVYKVFGRPGVKIFCSLGSSGNKEILKTIVQTLRQQENFNIACATTTILDPDELGLASDNFFAARFMPTHLVNEMADIAVTHGGQGTIQTSVWAGTPVVGVGFQSEQQANIDGLKRAGMGIRIPLYGVTPKVILKAVNEILQPSYKENALRMKELVRAHDGVANTVQKMNELLAGKL